MAVSEWSLLALGFALTVAGCIAAGALRGWGRWPAIAVCLASGALVTPAVVFGGFRLAGSTVGSQHTRLAFFASWLAGIALSVWLARVYARPEPREWAPLRCVPRADSAPFDTVPPRSGGTRGRRRRRRPRTEPEELSDGQPRPPEEGTEEAEAEEAAEVGGHGVDADRRRRPRRRSIARCAGADRRGVPGA